MKLIISFILMILFLCFGTNKVKSETVQGASHATQAKSRPAAPAHRAVKLSTAVPTATAVVVVTAPVLPVLPTNAVQYMPLLKKAVTDVWPDMPVKSYFGAQIEQETCISLKSKGCWNPHTELKTSREYGFGFGQSTIAYNSDGTERFNTWKEVKAMNKQLAGWKWEDRYNAEMQMKSLVVKNRFNWSRLKFPIADEHNKIAFLAVTYNAGLPLTDIRLCSGTPGCDPTHWFNTATHKGVEAYSTKSKVAVKGYGKSFFDISREYPNNIYLRKPKYEPYLDVQESK